MNKFNIAYLIAVMPFYLLAFSRNLGTAIFAFEITFGILFVYFIIQKGAINFLNLLSLYIVSLPIINLTKGSFFTYNIHAVILFAILFKAYLTFPTYFNLLKKNKVFVTIAIFSLIYYLISIWNTGNYFSNFRIFELLLMAIVFPLTFQNNERLKNMILLLSFNSILIMQVVISLGAERLMIDKSEFAGLEIGGSNPIGFGLPIAFCILMIVAGGKRISFNNNSYKITLLVFLAISLILSTSRGSILVVLIGLGLYYISQNKLTSFLKLLVIPLILILSLTILKDIDKNFKFAYDFLIERSSDNSNDINKISSGRAEQWDAVFSHLSKYPTELILGFGPGTQMEAHQIISYSTENKMAARMIGNKMAFHALILQLIVEIGIVGMMVFYIIILNLLYKSIEYYKKTVEILPTIGVISFFIIGLSVSSFDPFSGMFLGISFFSLIYKNKNYVRFIKQNNIINSPSLR